MLVLSDEGEREVGDKERMSPLLSSPTLVAHLAVTAALGPCRRAVSTARASRLDSGRGSRYVTNCGSSLDVTVMWLKLTSAFRPSRQTMGRNGLYTTGLLGCLFPGVALVGNKLLCLVMCCKHLDHQVDHQDRPCQSTLPRSLAEGAACGDKDLALNK